MAAASPRRPQVRLRSENREPGTYLVRTSICFFKLVQVHPLLVHDALQMTQQRVTEHLPMHRPLTDGIDQCGLVELAEVVLDHNLLCRLPTVQHALQSALELDPCQPAEKILVVQDVFISVETLLDLPPLLLSVFPTEYCDQA